MFKPSLPQGTRDFSPSVMYKRNYIIETIKKEMELFGFQPLETPAMENIETLMGKYGEEGDQLIFKILNNGLSHESKKEFAKEEFGKITQGKISTTITERALRYDLTIPFARFVAMNQHSIVFPFKRYQIQPVWRADRPQKGRYREFVQCDADIVGPYSIVYDVELLSLYQSVFKKLQLPVEIKINHRKLIDALAQYAFGCKEGHDPLSNQGRNEFNKFTATIAQAIDKLDKMEWDKVKLYLTEKEFSDEQIKKIEKFISIKGNFQEIVTEIKALFSNTDCYTEGSPTITAEDAIKDLQAIFNALGGTNEDVFSIVLDLRLARGLSYYTGMILEVKAKGVSMGSIGGGGKYDTLISAFGISNQLLKDCATLGISFGIDRMYDVMEELQRFPKNIDIQNTVHILVINLFEDRRSGIEKLYPIVRRLREIGIGVELDYGVGASNIKKQFVYAEKKSIPLCIIIGEKEYANDSCNLKDMRTKEEKAVPLFFQADNKLDILLMYIKEEIKDIPKNLLDTINSYLPSILDS